MTFTRKFSQFAVGGNLVATDIVVGLRGGVNTQFNAPTGGGGGGVVVPIIVPGNTFQIGQWIAINSSGQYVLAQANSIASNNTECIGVVVAIPVPNNTFDLQQSGYITSGQNVFSALFGSLSTVPYFLDTATPGNMVTTDAAINGQVSRPVFIPDGPDSGWVVPYRGLIVGGGAPMGVAGSFVDSNIHQANQPGHGFNIGQWLEVSTPTAGHEVYVKAVANSLANSQSVGVVIEVIDVNNFIIQFAGFVTTAASVTAPWQDSTGTDVTPGTVYYLSANVGTPGTLTSLNPTLIGQISKPLYIPTLSGGMAGPTSGWILPQRPLDQSVANAINPIIPGTFSVGTWVYISADGTYSPGLANNLATSQVVGVVTQSSGGMSTIQTDGYLQGVVTQDDVPSSINSATVYYLSPTVAGALTSNQPLTAGLYSKPCYIQETLATRRGIILPQRPLNLTGGGGGGSGWTLINTQTISSPQTFVQILNMTGFYRYMIVLENIIPDATAVGGTGAGISMQVSSNNGVSYATTGYYWDSTLSVAGANDAGIMITGNVGTGQGLTATSVPGSGGLSGFINVINPGQATYSKNFLIDTSWLGYISQLSPYAVKNTGSGFQSPVITLVNAVQFFTCYPTSGFPRGNIASGTFKLYGTNV